MLSSYKFLLLVQIIPYYSEKKDVRRRKLFINLQTALFLLVFLSQMPGLAAQHTQFKRPNLNRCLVGILNYYGKYCELVNYRFKKPTFLDAIDPSSQEWKRLSVRNSTQASVSSEYLENLYYSITEEFDPWFRNKKKSNFRKMLVDQHKKLVYGKTGKTPYKGFTSIGLDVPPSVFRNALSNNEPLLISVDNKLLKNEIGLERVNELRVKLKHETDPSVKIFIDGIHPQAWPEIFMERTGIMVQYPNAKYLNKYIDRMDVLMDEIRAINVNTSNKTKLLNTLAEYLQLGVVAHPFKRVNFSMLMGQVNYILKLHGFNGISHGLLDYAGLINDTVSFKKLFIQAVK